jgi:hypothetical protein
MMPDLREQKFYAESDHIRDNDDWEYPEEPEPEIQQNGTFQSQCQGILIPSIPHPQEDGRHQGQYHDDHGPFHIHGITDMRTFLGYMVGYKEKCLEGLEGGLQGSKLPTLFKIRLDLIYKPSQ